MQSSMKLTGPNEEWRSVVGYEGLYEVSSFGRVRSLPRVRPYKGGTPRRLKGKVLKTRIGATGYPVFSIYGGPKVREVKVHRIVAEAFIPNPDNLPFVLHWDNNPENNHVSNLRWGSPSENMYDTVRNGNHPGKNKNHCKQGHLLEEPNLLPSGIRRGIRVCLSCKRARSNSARDNRPFSKRRADMFYERIMSGEKGWFRDTYDSEEK